MYDSQKLAKKSEKSPLTTADGGKSLRSTIEICHSPIDWVNYKNMTLPKRKPWSEEDWLVHEKIFNRLAMPKKCFEPTPLVRQKVPLTKLLPRIAELAQPKTRQSEQRPPLFGMQI